MATLLWILLAAAVLTLAALRLPIRFGMDASLARRPRRIGGKLYLSFIHPAVFKYSYSTSGHREETVILGFKKRKKAEAHTVGGVGVDVNDVDDADDTGDADTINTVGTNGNAHDVDDVDDTYDDDGKTVYDDDDLLWARAARLIKKIFKDPLMTRALSTLREGLDDIKGSKGYRYVSDRALRRKIFKWLKRSWRGVRSSARLDKLSIRAKIGSRDPARIGKWFGYFIAARSVMQTQSRAVDVTMEPVFTERHFELDTKFAGRTSLAMLLSAGLSIALTFPYFHIRKIHKELEAKGNE